MSPATTNIGKQSKMSVSKKVVDSEKKEEKIKHRIKNSKE